MPEDEASWRLNVTVTPRKGGVSVYVFMEIRRDTGFQTPLESDADREESEEALIRNIVRWRRVFLERLDALIRYRRTGLRGPM